MLKRKLKKPRLTINPKKVKPAQNEKIFAFPIQIIYRFLLIDPDMEVRMKNTCPSKFLPFFPVNRNQVVLQII